MKNCALLTCENLDDFVHDEDHLERALQSKGWGYQWIQWKNIDVDWSQFDCAVVRTTWDYSDHPQEFLQQLKKVEESSCQLFNPYALIEWNWHKTYLKDIQNWGVPVVPTHWLDSFNIEALRELNLALGVRDYVIKPQVGAGAKNTFVFTDLNDPNLEKLKGQAVMVQAFQKNIQMEGEYSAHFFGENHSHCILKKPKPGDFRSQEEFGSHIAEVPLPSGIQVASQKILKKLGSSCLFARVDMVRSENQEFQLMELELIEPSLYFRMSDGSALRFVDALEQMIKK